VGGGGAGGGGGGGGGRPSRQKTNKNSLRIPLNEPEYAATIRFLVHKYCV